MLLAIPGVAQRSAMNHSLGAMLLDVSLHGILAADVQFAVRRHQQVEFVPEEICQSAAQKSAATRNHYLLFHRFVQVWLLVVRWHIRFGESVECFAVASDFLEEHLFGAHPKSPFAV